MNMWIILNYSELITLLFVGVLDNQYSILSI